MKRVTKIMLVLVAILMLCSCVPRREENDGSFYVRTSYVTGGSGGVSPYILEISAAQEQANVLEASNIQFSLGVGRTPVSATDEYDAWMIIRADNCGINGEKDVLRKDYADFFQNDIYAYKKGPRTIFGLGSSPLYPQHYEMIEISFPKQDSSGMVSIELFSTLEMEFMDNENAAVTLTFRYKVENGVLTLIEE